MREQIKPLQEEFQGNEKTGDVVHVSFLIQDWGRVGDRMFPECTMPSRQSQNIR
jgi:hypothetical protein